MKKQTFTVVVTHHRARLYRLLEAGAEGAHESWRAIERRGQSDAEEILVEDCRIEVVTAGSRFAAAIHLLDSYLEGRRQALRDSEAPRAVLASLNRPRVIEELEQLADAEWKFAWSLDDYYVVESLSG